MDKKIILLDLEQSENICSIGVIGLSGDDREAVDFMAAGKNTIPLAKPGSELAALLERVCGLYTCDDRGPKDFPFYPVPQFCLFGEDEYQTVYGLIGELNENRPVGFVTKDGGVGKLAAGIKEFLTLTALCPGWQKAVAEGAPFPPCTVNLSPEQQRLLELLQLPADREVLVRAEQCRREDAGFAVYASREEAGKEWTFV